MPDDVPSRLILAELAAQRGAALSRLGRPDEALAEVRLLLDEAPSHVPSLVLMAQILIDVGRTGEAAAALDRALELDPGDEEAQRQMARLAAPEEMPPKDRGRGHYGRGSGLVSSA